MVPDSRDLHPIHDPAELALLGLPAGIWGWVAELDATDLAELGYGDWPGFTAKVVGVDNWDPSPGAGWTDADARHPRVIQSGAIPLDIVYIEARMKGTAASLVWSRRSPDERGRLDGHHLEDVRGRKLTRLLRARRLVDLDFSKLLGRPVGSLVMTEPQFRAALPEARAAVRRRRERVTQKAVAKELGLSLRTFQTYLKEWRISLSGEQADPPR